MCFLLAIQRFIDWTSVKFKKEKLLNWSGDIRPDAQVSWMSLFVNIKKMWLNCKWDESQPHAIEVNTYRSPNSFQQIEKPISHSRIVDN